MKTFVPFYPQLSFYQLALIIAGFILLQTFHPWNSSRVSWNSKQEIKEAPVHTAYDIITQIDKLPPKKRQEVFNYVVAQINNRPAWTPSELLAKPAHVPALSQQSEPFGSSVSEHEALAYFSQMKHAP